MQISDIGRAPPCWTVLVSWCPHHALRACIKGLDRLPIIYLTLIIWLIFHGSVLDQFDGHLVVVMYTDKFGKRFCEHVVVVANQTQF